MAKKSTPDWTLAPAPESTDHVRINAQYELFIGGKWQKPVSGKCFDTINPANDDKLARIAVGDPSAFGRGVIPYGIIP